jgi:hypothetical protein
MLLMMIGRMALSSKLPWAPAAATIESSPRTCRQTMTIASCWVGLTFPGMIELPGSFSGSTSSCSPARGPEASQRMSLAAFIWATATPRRPALTATMASNDPWAAYLLRAVRSGSPVSCASSAAISSANPSGALRPVPTAVPPGGQVIQAREVAGQTLTKSGAR